MYLEGKDFSRQFLTGSNSTILNEAAVQHMGLKKPIGETVRMNNNNYTAIRVVKKLVMNSPYEPVKQTIFNFNKGIGGFLNIKDRSNC